MDRLAAHQGEYDAQQRGDPSANYIGANEGTADNQPEQTEEEYLPVAELQGDGSHKGLDEKHNHHGGHAGEDRGVERITHRLGPPALLAQRIAVYHGGGGGGRTGNIRKARRNTACGNGRHKNAQQQSQRVVGLHFIDDAQDQGHTHGGSQAGNHADDKPQRHTAQQDQQGHRVCDDIHKRRGKVRPLRNN